MTTVYLRVGVWLVVVASVLSGGLRSRSSIFSQTVTVSPTPSAPREVSPLPFVEETSPNTVFFQFSLADLCVLTSQPPKTNLPAALSQSCIGDFQRRGTITFLMYHSPASYFLQRGGQVGFEYELAKQFAEDIGVELEIRTPPSGTDIVSWFNDGKGDIIAGLTTTDGIDPGPVEVSHPYFDTTAQVITRSDASAPRSITELAGQPVAVQPGSVYAQQLQVGTQALALPPVLFLTSGDEAMGETLSAVVQGRASATVVMDPLARLAHNLYPGRLRTAWPLPQPIRLVWAVRSGQTQLLQAINAYLERASRSGLKKILLEKYFATDSLLRNITGESEGTLTVTKRLSRYDRLIARHAEEAGFDWRLVAAVIFEESRFDHTRISGAGAYGLMQVMPFTAQLVGTKNYLDPRDNIETGVKYLQSLSRRFQQGRPQDRLALTLASYVMGFGHVEDAQRIARLLGYDPDCWTESMERVLPLLENPKYYSKTLFGSAQGQEAVRYTNAILKRYRVYSQYFARDIPPAEVRTVPTGQAASAAG